MLFEIVHVQPHGGGTIMGVNYENDDGGKETG